MYLHLCVYGGWIILNLGWLPVRPFDPTFVVLAMVASVEAIFISTFVMISQNRMAALADQRADLDLQISLLGEHEITRLLTLVTEIARGYTALDGFCDEAGTVNVQMLRAKWSVEFAEAGDHTLVTTTERYNSPEDVRNVIAMGMKGGMTSTLERLDELLITRNASTAL